MLIPANAASELILDEPDELEVCGTKSHVAV